MRLGNRDFAIIKLNPSVVKVIDGVPYDKDDKEVTYDSDAVDTELNIQEVRMIRNAKLAETDWTQNRDVTLTNDAAWQTYRQALRDITDTYTSLDDVVWPEKP
jgi:hypothetical protein